MASDDVNGSGGSGEVTPAWYRPPKPYEPGNTAAVQSGARSERLLSELAAGFIAELLADPSTPAHVRLPVFRGAVETWGWDRARVTRQRAYVDKLSTEEALSEVTTETETLEPGPGRGRKRLSRSQRLQAGMDALDRSQRALARSTARLGLDPASAAALAKDAAFALATAPEDPIKKMAREGAEVRERRERELRADPEKWRAHQYAVRYGNGKPVPPGWSPDQA